MTRASLEGCPKGYPGHSDKDGDTVSTATSTTRTHAALRYTAMRLGVFAGCFGVVWLLAYVRVIPVTGATGVVFLLALAAVVSAPVSYVVLSRQRDAMSEQIVGKVEETRQRLADNRTQEDAADDAARAATTRTHRPVEG